MKLEDSRLAKRAWKHLLGDPGWQRPENRFKTVKATGPEVLRSMEVSPWVSTNETAQWCLNAIQVLALIGDQMPENNPAWN